MDTIPLHGVMSAASNLDIVKGVAVEVNPFNRQILVALYDRRDSKCPIQGSWIGDGTESIDKLRNIQERYGQVQGAFI